MVPKRPRSSKCERVPERLISYYEEAREEASEPPSRPPTPEVTERQKPEEGVLEGKSVAIVDVGVSCKDYVTEALAAGGQHAIADEVWAIDDMIGLISHDRAFSLRPLSSRDDLSWVLTHPGPLYCSDNEEARGRFPGSVPYPLEEVLNSLGLAYLTSSAAYALAFAMMQGVQRVKLYGVDALEVRPCMEFLVCKALHAGITVQISGASMLMGSCLRPEDKLYGFCEKDDPPVPQRSEGARIVLSDRSQSSEATGA